MAVRLPNSFEPQCAMSLSSLVTSIEYKTGAIYDGDVNDQAKEGTGVFTWPNGDSYSGQFSNDKRNGKGDQVWSDGDSYSGDYVDDLRHGRGEYRWSNGERYAGIFFKDHRHGPGEYFWSDGSHFTGTFYMDKKEGYGEILYANGDRFEGLYKADEREGPGVMTYADGAQDVGLWHRERLARLLTKVDGTFSLADHPELQFDPKLAQVRLPIEGRPHSELDAFLDSIVNPPPQWNYDAEANERVRSRLDEVMTGCRPDSAAFNKLDSDANFEKSVGLPEKPEELQQLQPIADQQTPSPIGDDESSKSPARSSSKRASPAKSPKRSSPTRRPAGKGKKKSEQETPELQPQSTPAAEDPNTVAAWNPTPASIEMQLHAMRFKPMQDRVNFDVDSVVRGDRSSFNTPGQLELRSMALIQSAKAGDLAKVKSLLSRGDLDPNVSDSCGKTPLLCASVNWNQPVINCLLDAGADINRLSDEGSSCLSACFVHFYPPSVFQHNIAEAPVKRLTEEEQKMARKAAARAAQKKQQQHQQLAPLDESKPLANDQQQQQQQSRTTDALIDPVLAGGRFAGTLTGGRRPDFATNQQWSLSDEEQAADDSDDSCDSELGERGQRGGRGGRQDGGEDPAGPAASVASADSPHPSEDFESTDSLANYKITVPEELVRRAATALSINQLAASRLASAITGSDAEGDGEADAAGLALEGKSRGMAAQMTRQKLMSDTVHLLLERGADPNASLVPFPALFFAVKAGDTEMVRALLQRGADVTARLQSGRGGLTALHIAVALPGDAGVSITELLLHSLAFPDARAEQDDSFLDRTLEDDWLRDEIRPEQQAVLGGRTPLQIAASRDEDHRRAHRIVLLLLQHKADPNLTCNGHSALALAIESGNDLAVDELLRYRADVNQSLSHGVGSCLCQAASITHEARRNLKGRLDLLDKLIDSGSDILQPIAIGVKRQLGTAVDYGWQLYNLDKRVAFTPYHALNPTERQAFQDRNIVLKHLGNRLREKAVERERARLEAEEAGGVQSRGPSANFVYTGAGASPPATRGSGDTFLRQQEVIVRRPILKYCYDCGRSVGVRLTPCTRCKEVYFCSKACKIRAWTDRHKDECQRIGGGAGPRHNDTRIDSPTPATDADRDLKKPTASNLSRRLADIRLKNPMRGRSVSAVPGGRAAKGGMRLPPLQGGAAAAEAAAAAAAAAAGGEGGGGGVRGGRRRGGSAAAGGYGRSAMQLQLQQ